MIQDPGARIQEPGARSQEPGARSQDPGARSQEPGARSHLQPEEVLHGLEGGTDPCVVVMASTRGQNGADHQPQEAQTGFLLSQEAHGCCLLPQSAHTALLSTGSSGASRQLSDRCQNDAAR